MRESVVQRLFLTALHGPSNLPPPSSLYCLPPISLVKVMKRRNMSPLLRVRYTTPSGSGPDETQPAVTSSPAHVCPVPPGSPRRLAARKDTPVLKPTSRGGSSKAFAAIKSEDTKQRALLELRKDMNAQSAGAPRDSLLKTWVQFHGAWFGHQSLDDEAQPFPLTVMSIYAVGAMLKSGGYRSPSNYLSRAKKEHIVRGHLWTDELSLAVRKTTSSITRGMGPGRQSSPVDISCVWKLDLPWCSGLPGAPLGGRCLVAGSFFSVREIELSLALRKHVVVDSDSRRVTWLLPCSKTVRRPLVNPGLGTAFVASILRSLARTMLWKNTANYWTRNSAVGPTVSHFRCFLT